MLSLARRSLPRPPLPCHVRLASNSVSTLKRGRNLTERYRKLEDIARAESEHGAQVSVLSASSKRAMELESDGPTRAQMPMPPDTIAGLVIPQEPRAPSDDECCMSGCAVCVYDLYEEALAEYKDAMMMLRATLTERHIPETEWPAHIRAVPTPAMAEKSKGVVLDAFEEMERALNEKREKRAAVEAESSS